MRGVIETVGRAALAATVAAALAAGCQAAPPPAATPAAGTVPGAMVRPVQATPDPDQRARALLRQFPWIAAFWAELRGEERGRAERAFRRAGRSEGFDTAWDAMGLQDRVLLLFGPGRARPG
jgi:hypothetical protein